MLNYFRQIYYEMRHQRMMTWVSISGTALAIFLVMAYFMSESVHTVEVSPESRRSRILYGMGLDLWRIENGNSASSNGITRTLAERFYGDLDGVEKICYVEGRSHSSDVCVGDGDILTLDVLGVDGRFWDIYDFRFISGHPFSKEESDVTAKKAVIDRSTARRLFGEVDVAGRELMVDYVPYVVSGVVEDVSPLLTNTFAHAYVPLGEDKSSFWNESEFAGYMSNITVRLLKDKDAESEDIKGQVKERIMRFGAELKKDSLRVVYHQQPWTSEEVAASGLMWSNADPETESKRRMDLLIYGIMLLVPAINLSSMTRSRLRRRVSEIGVRRAFGAKRTEIIGQLFMENFIMTLIGGILGFALSLVCMMLISHMFIYSGQFWGVSEDLADARPVFEMLFRWKQFLYALLFCFILNLLSATVPAWRASRSVPADAIAGGRK